VRIKACRSPLSSIALRAAVMRRRENNRQRRTARIIPIKIAARPRSVLGNNQGNLSDKESFPQSLRRRLAAFSTHADRVGRGRNEMESTMFAQHQDIRRRLDRSIDIDFYRQRSLMERRIVMTGFFKGFGQVVRPLAAVALIAATLLAAPPRDGTGWVAPTASVAGSNKLSLAYPMTTAPLYALNAAR
jgi:hypothetical protein